MTLIPQIQTQDGRTTATTTFNNHTIEVVAVYDINEDRFPFHVYVTDFAKKRKKIDFSPSFAQSLKQAIEDGLEFGKVAVESI